MSLPKWISTDFEHTFKTGNCAVGSACHNCKVHEALSIACEALEKYARHTTDCDFELDKGPCTCGFGLGRCEALRRIQQLGADKSAIEELGK